MPNISELKRLLKSVKLIPLGIGYVIRAANAPSRKANGRYLSVHDTIASRKTKLTQNAESRSAELPFLLWCEFSSTVIAYYDQPEAIKISYLNNNGKRVTHLETPDFVVVRDDGVYLVECKKSSFLETAITEKPNRYIKSGDRYSSPPAIAAASELGLQHVISTDRDFTTSFTRNCIFLLNFIDELKYHDEGVSEQIVQTIKRSGNRIRLNNLYDVYPQESVIQAIFHKYIFSDLNSQLLCQPDFVWIYHDRTYLDAITRIKKENSLIAANSIRQLMDVKTVWWKNVEWEVLHVGAAPNSTLTMRGPSRTITLAEVDLTDAFNTQDIYIQDPSSIAGTTERILCAHKAHQLEEALTRYAILEGTSNVKIVVSDRTLKRWKEKAEKSDDPLLGLISKKHNRGNRNPRKSQEVSTLIEQLIKESLLQPSPPSTYHVYGDFKEICTNQGLRPCSLKSFYAHVKKIDKPYRVLKQKGFRAAYALGPEPRDIDLDWDLPYHGDFVFEVAHVDHTPLEITLLSELTGEPLEGSLNLSILYDGHSRIILAIYISFEKPSYRATMMLLRECYRRYNRLPLFLAADHGPDFASNYFDSTLANLGMHKRRRPKCASRHGSTIERVFGTTESELIHLLQGNKQLQKLGRGQSTSHLSSKHALWTPDKFDIALKDYVYLRYPQIERRGIAETAQSRWDRSVSSFDECPGTKVKSEAAFMISTLPDASRDGCRVLNKNQLHFNNISYLLSAKVAGYSGDKCRIPVKYDPYNIAHIWGRIKNRWVRLTTNDVLVRECHDKGVQLAHMEVYSRRLRHSKRYRQGPKASLALHAQNPQPEQHQFNLDQSSTGPVIDQHNVPSPGHKKIDFDSLDTLPSTHLSRGKKYE